MDWFLASRDQRSNHLSEVSVFAHCRESKTQRLDVLWVVKLHEILKIIYKSCDVKGWNNSHQSCGERLFWFCWSCSRRRQHRQEIVLPAQLREPAISLSILQYIRHQTCFEVDKLWVYKIISMWLLSVLYAFPVHAKVKSYIVTPILVALWCSLSHMPSNQLVI